MTKSPSVMRPETTARPPMRSTAATASVGRNSSSGRYEARWRVALMLASNTSSARSRKRAVSRSSWPKAFTTRTPTTFSSACVVTSARRCCTSVSTGWETRE